MTHSIQHRRDVDHEGLRDGRWDHVGTGVCCAERGRGRERDAQGTGHGIIVGRTLNGHHGLTGFAQGHVRNKRRRQSNGPTVGFVKAS